MMTVNGKTLPPESAGLQLHRIHMVRGSEHTTPCEAIRFPGGMPAVDTVLRRAALSGRVEVGGQIENHFADVLNDNAETIETVALDRHSYSALKNRWMRCKTEPTS